MSGKRFTEEFKKEAIKQITERNYSVAEVAEQLGNIQQALALTAVRGYTRIYVRRMRQQCASRS